MLRWIRCLPTRLLASFTIPHTVTLQETMKSLYDRPLAQSK